MKRILTFNRSAARALTKRLTLLLFSLIAMIVIVDLFTFFVLDIKVPGYRPERFFHFSFLNGYFHKPNAKGYWYRYYNGEKYYVRTNSYGFADSEREVEKKRPRIALIGDSTTEFWEVDEAQRGQYVLEKRLNDTFEVLNFSVRGYGTDQTFLLFRHLGVHFQPDIVVYMFCINDVWDNSDTVSKPYFVLDEIQEGGLRLEGYPIRMVSNYERMDKYKGLKRISFIYRTLRSFARQMKDRGILRNEIVPLESHFELLPYKRDYDYSDKTKMEITKRIIGKMAAFVESQDMKFLFVEGLYKPALDPRLQACVVDRYGDLFAFDKVSSLFSEFAAEEGIPFLSLPRKVQEKELGVSTLMHPSDQMHLNSEGIRLYAESIAEKLAELGWLD